MKILQVIPTLDPAAGGPVEGLIQQGAVMAQFGHDVQTVCLDPPGSPIDPRLRASAVYLLGPRHLKYGFAPGLEPWLREHGRAYDVIIVHGLWSYHGYCVAKVARQLHIPYVVFLHGMLDPWFARQFPLKHLKKWMYWPWAEYRSLRDASLVLLTTQDELMLARQSFWLYKVRERLVGYGIRDRDVAVGQARQAFVARFPETAGTRNFLYLSRLHPKKGCDLLVRAFAAIAPQHPDLRLIMAGPGDDLYIRTIRELVDTLGLSSRVTFTGILRDEMKWGAYDSADAFVLPSHQENFGIVLVEALASGLPVLTTRQVNIWKEVDDAGAGIIDVDTQEGAQRLLEHWLALSQSARDAMRVRAVACFRAHFHMENVTRNLLAALQDAVRNPRAPYTFSGSLKSLMGST